MATSIELINGVSAVFAVNQSTCANVFRDLRSAGVVSNEGRGRHAARMTVRDAAHFLIAICGAEQVQDASDAVRRFGSLLAGNGIHPSGIIVPSPTWGDAKAFPCLAVLPRRHSFADALAALIETYSAGDPETHVGVAMRGPYPSASVEIVIEDHKRPTAIWYSDEGDEDGPGELALIDNTKERQRRKFVALGGDLNVTASFSNRALAAIGELLRS